MKAGAFFKRISYDAAGATAVEYGLLLGVIAILIFASVQGVGNANSANWSDVAEKVINAG